MTRAWKVTVVLSVSLNIACFVAIGGIAERLVDEQAANLKLFMQLSVDQQALRRALNEATARLESGSR